MGRLRRGIAIAPALLSLITLGLGSICSSEQSVSTDGSSLSVDEIPDEDIDSILEGATIDCNHNGVDDQVEFDRGTAFDSNGNGVLDECEPVAGDVDHDDVLGINDGRMLSLAVGSVEGVHRHFILSADLNEDHRIDSVDVAIWGRLWKAATGSSLACSDSYDNDGDGKVDFPVDAGCADAVSDLENPECGDGIDNDGDGATDFPADAGRAVGGSAEEE